VNVNIKSPLAFEGEDYVLVLHVLRPERWDEADGRPNFEETTNCAQSCIICILQHS
jgi:hypothetical protein